MENEIQNLLSVKQTAAKLGVRPAFIYDMVSRGDLPSIRMRHTIRIKPSELNDFLLNATTNPKDNAVTR
jgi:excisionase family DNA binding protein